MNNKEFLAYFGGEKIIKNAAIAKFNWPKISSDMEKVVISQLHETISIYDKSSIFDIFEKKFANFHNMKYGLLFNSGTSAIFSMYDAIGLMPNDEVICPVYTFHATVSPMMFFGAIPVFCDSDSCGNISFNEIKKLVNKKTKAIVVTHMWGIPCKDIEEIRNFCKENNLFLLEDCSHAHGASINNQKVGSFGDISVWSLQGQKVISGGEGGILLTNNQLLYNKSLIFGHYNKRPLNEINNNDFLHNYYLTGKGLKLRAHPLAIAIANHQFELIDDFLKNKNIYASMFDEIISSYPFLSRPNILDKKTQNSWYVYGFLFDETKSFGITKQQFQKLLIAEGLTEIDIPNSTKLLNKLELFNNPQAIFPSLYQQFPIPIKEDKIFPVALDFYKRFVKMPVWGYPEDKYIVDLYVQGLKKVCNCILSIKDLYKFF